FDAQHKSLRSRLDFTEKQSPTDHLKQFPSAFGERLLNLPHLFAGHTSCIDGLLFDFHLHTVVSVTVTSFGNCQGSSFTSASGLARIGPTGSETIRSTLRVPSITVMISDRLMGLPKFDLSGAYHALKPASIAALVAVIACG